MLALDPPTCGESWFANGVGGHFCIRDEKHAGPHRCDCGKTRKASPKKKPRAKKPSRTKLKKTADELFSLRVRSRGYCQAKAGWPHTCGGGGLQCCHIEGRANHRLRWEDLNALAMCYGAHRWFTSHPAAWWIFIEENFPESLAFIRAHINEPWDKDIESVLSVLQGLHQEEK